MSNAPYFATLSGSSLAREVEKRVDNFYKYLFRDYSYRRAIESYRTHNGLPTPLRAFDAIDVLDTQDSSGSKKSHLKSTIYSATQQAIITMTTANRPSIECIPSNTDSASEKAVLLADDLIPFFFKAKRLEEKWAEAVASAAIMCEGYVSLLWNASAGQALTVDGVPVPNPETGEPQYLGDIESHSYTPFDVAVDLEARGSGSRPWVILRQFVNKADFKAQWKAYASEIDSCQITNAPRYRWPDTHRPWADKGKDSEQIAVWILLHRKTTACPEGKIAFVISDDTCVFQGPLPYGDEIPLIRIVNDKQVGTNKGRSQTILQLGAHRVLEEGLSVIASNISSWGYGVMVGYKGTGASPSDLGNGITMLEVDPPEDGRGDGFPKVLDQPVTAQAVFESVQLLEKLIETGSGVNATVKGQAPVEWSGSAMLLQTEQARQFTSPLQRSSAEGYEGLANLLLAILKKEVNSPRVTRIVGENKRAMLQEWQSSNLAPIELVQCNIGSSVLNTIAGRIQVAADLMAKGLLTAQQYLEILRTGELEADTDPIEMRMLRIRMEGELLRTGQNPVVTYGDGNHLEEAAQHELDVLSDSSARNNQLVREAVKAHCDQHRWMAQQPSATIPTIAPPGAKPAPPPPAPPPPQSVPLTSLSVSMPAPQTGGPAQVASGQGPQRGPQLPQMPNPPKKPGT